MVRLLITLGLLSLTAMAHAGKPTFEVAIENHLFVPSEIVVPAHTKIRLLIHNRDETPEEFESYEMNREKVIPGGAKSVIFIGPLEPGRYPYFGEFNPDTAEGVIVAE